MEIRPRDVRAHKGMSLGQCYYIGLVHDTGSKSESIDYSVCLAEATPNKCAREKWGVWSEY
jgi:hypothetical protein